MTWQLYKPPGVPIEAGTPGHNEHGVPLHACNGYRHDAHYWAWLEARWLDDVLLLNLGGVA